MKHCGREGVSEGNGPQKHEGNVGRNGCCVQCGAVY